MMHIRRNEERGHVQHGWLDSKHTFSFGEYHDERFNGFRSLRVINEDLIAAGEGFGKHPHKSMEILTYMVEGAVRHTDSMGNAEVIKPGDVQYLSAGSGITHSEMNGSEDERAHLLQIWIIPREQGGKPNYGQQTFPIAERKNKLRLLAGDSADAATLSAKAIPIHQDAKIFASVLEHDQKLEHAVDKTRYYWVQNAKGRLDVTVKMKGTVNTETLHPGDALAVSEADELSFSTPDSAEFLLFDLA